MAKALDVVDIADESPDEEDDKAMIEQIKRDSLKLLEASEKLNQIKEDPNVSTTDIFYRGEDAKGFFVPAGETYIYPTNYPIRDYQKNIVNSCLFDNTLVSLPTGLGKTFIAAVVMFNFYRWYPRGKIVFMAPTRPLVSQQMRACYDIMGIPVEDTIELLGTTNVAVRKKEWDEKRVFYVTPQTIDNDLKNGVFDPQHLKCLVIDEAHRATKNYAYCQVVQQLRDAGVKFRLVALSATPGREIQDVINLIVKLDIAKLELRSENSIDIVPYTHTKKIDSVEVPLSDLVLRVREEFLKVIDRYTRSLKQNKVLVGNTGTLTKFLVMLAKDRYVKTKGQFPHINRDLDKMIQRDFHVTHSLASALENLTTYGLRAFYNNLVEVSKEDGSCPLLGKDQDLQELLQQLKPKLDINIMSNDYAWSHLKFIRLREILETHFRTHAERGETTKVIIFANFRVVVAEIAEVLKSLEPMVKASMFVGQSSGVTQQEQKDIMKKFRDGEFNTLIATSVGEEGLDIGEIDLVICFDSQKSPIKLVQRLGRTGRKRNGRCVFLLTQGKEAQNFKTGMQTCKSYVEKIINNKSIYTSLARNGPRMIPAHVTPSMRCLHIVVKDRVTPAKGSKKKAKEAEKPKGKGRRKLDNSEQPARVGKSNAKKSKNPPPMSQSNDIRTCFENLSKKKKTYIDIITQSSGEPATCFDQEDEVVIVEDQMKEFESLFAKLESWSEKCVTNDELIMDDEFFGFMDNFLINDTDQTPVNLMDVDQMLESEDIMMLDFNEEHKVFEASVMTTPTKIQQRSDSPDFSSSFQMNLMNVLSPYETNRPAQQNEGTSKPAHCSSPIISDKNDHYQKSIKDTERFEEDMLEDGNDDIFLNINSLVPSHMNSPIKNQDMSIFKNPKVIKSTEEFLINKSTKEKEENYQLKLVKEPFIKTIDRPMESNHPAEKHLETSVYQSVDELFASDEDTSPIVENNDIRSYFVSEAEIRDGASYVEPMSVSDLFEDSSGDEDNVEDEKISENGRKGYQVCDEKMIIKSIKMVNYENTIDQNDVQKHSSMLESSHQDQLNELGINLKHNQHSNQRGISTVSTTKTPGRDGHPLIKTADWPCSSTPMISGPTQKKISNIPKQKNANDPPDSPDLGDIFFTQSKASGARANKTGRSPFTPKQKLSQFFKSPDVSEIKSQAVKPSAMSAVKINLESKFTGSTNNNSKLFVPGRSQNKSKSPSCEIIFDTDSDEDSVPVTKETDNNVTNLDGTNMFTVTQLVDMACEREKKLQQTSMSNFISTAPFKTNESNLTKSSKDILTSNKENLVERSTPRKLDGMEIVDSSDEELMLLGVQFSPSNDKSLINSYITTRHLAHPKPYLPPTKSVLTKLSFVEENQVNKPPADTNAVAKEVVNESSDDDLEFFIPKRNPKKAPVNAPKSPLLLSKTKIKTKVTSQTPNKNSNHLQPKKLSNLSLNDSEEELELLRSLAKSSDLGHLSRSEYFSNPKSSSAASSKKSIFTKNTNPIKSSDTSQPSSPPSKQAVFNLPAIPKPSSSKTFATSVSTTPKVKAPTTAQPTQSALSQSTQSSNLEAEFGGMTDAQFEAWLQSMNGDSSKDPEPVTSQYFAPKPCEKNAHQLLMANRSNLKPSGSGASLQKVPAKTSLTRREQEHFERVLRKDVSLHNSSRSSSSAQYISSEDDDFDFFKNPQKPQSTHKRQNQQASKVHDPPSSRSTPRKPTGSKARPNTGAPVIAGKKKPRKKKTANPYIEVEADVSVLEGHGMSSDDDLTNSSEDEMDSSFIDDEQDKDHTMAVYLKSVRSPPNGGGAGGSKFKIPVLSDAVLGMDVYSQAVPADQAEYEHDSFCVEDEEVEDEDEEAAEEREAEISLLEMAERKLERERRLKKKRGREEKAKPRRRVIRMVSSSDED